jgi:methylenetetrahydrofolate dehydrogenase (NADP+)/methenyltetrahydrofolate cyclohydrolase
MMANDGAEVISFDIDGAKLFTPIDGAHRIKSTDIERPAALAQADVVVTGVPSRAFPLVRAAEIKEGAICVNFSTLRNFDDDVLQKAGVFVPRIGPMTVTMALGNTLELYRQARMLSGDATP